MNLWRSNSFPYHWFAPGWILLLLLSSNDINPSRTTTPSSSSSSSSVIMGVNGWTLATTTRRTGKLLQKRVIQTATTTTKTRANQNDGLPFSAAVSCVSGRFSSPFETTRLSMSSKNPSPDDDGSNNKAKKKRGRILVLGGTGFLGQTVCHEALQQGFQVTSLSRRGLPPQKSSREQQKQKQKQQQQQQQQKSNNQIDYRQGDATQKESIRNILFNDDDEYVGIVHCIGLLLDSDSGLGDWNRLASGSGSRVTSSSSTYDAITRQTAFHAMEAAREYVTKKKQQQQQRGRPKTPFPFCFTSAAEAGWPDMPGGTFVEQKIVPEFLQRYLVAKRAVERELLQSPASSSEQSSPVLRPIIVRPSLIYARDRPASFLSVGAFFLGSQFLPFVDPPVTVQALAKTIVKSIQDPTISGILRYPEITKLGGKEQ